MLGKYLRGFHHLLRVSKEKDVVKFYAINHRSISKCECFYCKSGLAIFNNFKGSIEIRHFSDTYVEKAQCLFKKYNYCFFVYDSGYFAKIGKSILLLCDDFEEQYEAFISNNKKMFHSIFEKYCNRYSDIPMFFFALTGNSPNTFLWAVNNYFRNDHYWQTIGWIIQFSDKYKNLISKTSKKTITAYNSYQNINALREELLRERMLKRSNDVINSFNTRQKAALKGIELSKKQIIILNKFFKLSEVKKNNFIRKMSTIEDANEIIRQMSYLVDIHFEWNKESLLEYVAKNTSLKYDIVFDNNNTILFKVYDFETIKSLGKATSWCISKNRQYWRNYVKGNFIEQYVLFDFSKNEDDDFSIVGFTVDDKCKITAAHSFRNNNLLYQNSRNGFTRLSSFTEEKFTNNISQILSDNCVNLSAIFDFSNSNYEWNMESFLDFMDYSVGKEEYVIEYCNEEESKLVISTNSDMIRFAIGKVFRYDLLNYRTKIYLFLDFKKKIEDDTRLIYAVINRTCSEEYLHTCFYTVQGSIPRFTFNDLLEEYHLPFNFICRTDDKFKMFENSLSCYDFKLMKKMIADKEVINKISENYIGIKNTIYSRLSSSINEYNSFDFLDFIYDNGLTVEQLVDKNSMKSLFEYVVNELYLSFPRGYVYSVPSGNIRKKLENGKINANTRFWHGNLCIFNMMVEHEDKRCLCELVLEKIMTNSLSDNFSALNDILYGLSIEILNFKSLNKTTRKILGWIGRSGYLPNLKKLYDKEISEECGYFLMNFISKSNQLYGMFEKRFPKDKEEQNIPNCDNDMLVTKLKMSECLSVV